MYTIVGPHLKTTQNTCEVFQGGMFNKQSLPEKKGKSHSPINLVGLSRIDAIYPLVN